MKVELEQRRGINSVRKFILFDEKILIEQKTLRKIDKYEVKLERLGLDIQYQKENTWTGKIVVGVCAIFIVLISIGYFIGKIDFNMFIVDVLIFSLAIALGFLRKNQDDIFLVGGQNQLILYRNVPDEQSVLDFINRVRSQIKLCLKNKYTLIDSTISSEVFYGRINRLRDQEIITYPEYVELKTKFDAQRFNAN